ncbi:UBN2 domain-containing protein [Tanacetum coccineum]
MEDPKIKMTKDKPYELLKDDEKKQLGKNDEAKMTLFNALPRKEYERVFMCKTANEVWHTLIITHQGNSQVKNFKIDLLTQEYEKFSISNEETIDSGFTRFNAIMTSLKSLDPDYSSKNYVRKFLHALPLKWKAKVTDIEGAKDLSTLAVDELIGNLKVCEMVLDNDSVASNTNKLKVKSLALKVKVTREQTVVREEATVGKNVSNKRICGSDHDRDSDQQQSKRIEVVREHATGASNKKAYAGNLPYCNKYKLHHTGPCTVKCGNCKRVGHMTKNCRTSAPTKIKRAPVANQKPTVTCFGCGAQGYFKSKCPRLKNRGIVNLKRRRGKQSKNSKVARNYMDA